MRTRKPLLQLSPEQRTQLQRLRDTHLKPYIRERAAALLKLADGHSLNTVARTGLLRPRSLTTVRTLLQRFQAEGVAGLDIRAERGRNPAFSP